MQAHWRGIARNITERKPFSYNSDGGTGIWEYRPFKLVDTRLTGVDKQAEEPVEGKMRSAAQLQDAIAELQAGRLPVRFEYASATLLDGIDNRGDVNKARITFEYPTVAKFERQVKLDSGTKNVDGDTVIGRTEVSTRSYSPEIPLEVQFALDDAKAASRRAVEEAIEQHGGEDFYMMADDGTTEYNNEARFAPIYNML